MSQKTDKMLKLALVFFISLLSFSIGTFVGKKYSDNQHKLAMLEPHKNKDTATQDFAANSDEKLDAMTAAKNPAEQQLTDNEVAKIAEEFASDSSEANATDDVNSEKDIPVTEAQVKDIKTINPDKKPLSKVAASKPAAASAVPTVKNNTKPVANVAQIHTAIEKIKKMETREVASVPTANQYTVQVGSFPTQAEADKLSHDLVNKGYKASSVPAVVNGQTWHRVQVGIFGSVKEAQDYKKDFLEKTKLSSAIVQRIQK